MQSRYYGAIVEHKFLYCQGENVAEHYKEYADRELLAVDLIELSDYNSHSRHSDTETGLWQWPNREGFIKRLLHR